MDQLMTVTNEVPKMLCISYTHLRQWEISNIMYHPVSKTLKEYH